MREVPKIQRSPISIDEAAIHYGYCAFKEIGVHDRRVQPAESPYYKELPCRELIPFTNIQEALPITENNDPERQRHLTSGPIRTGIGKNGEDPTVYFKEKSARACIYDVAWSYEEWGFKVLPLTGLDEDTAFHIFQTIQPFTYKLKDLEAALDEAETRINATTEYDVTYGDITETLQPLPQSLKETAFNTLEVMRSSVSLALEKSNEIVAKTNERMESYFAGQGGKSKADPLDRYVFDQMERSVPTRLTVDEQNKPGQDQAAAILKLAETIANQSVKPAPSEDVDAILQRLAEKEAMLDELLTKATKKKAA